MDYCHDDRGQWDLIKLPPENIMNLFGQYLPAACVYEGDYPELCPGLQGLAH